MSWLVLLLLAGNPPHWDPQRTEHLDELGRLLKRHTAFLEVHLQPVEGQPMAEKTRTGFGVALEPNLVATNHFVVDRARHVEVIGPKKKKLRGTVVLSDAQRRVALIRTERPLAETGLVPAQILPKKERKKGADVFALVSTMDMSGVVHGVLMNTGGALELEGHPRTSLALYYAMPVFDGELRFVGFARTVSWDKDKQMLVPPDKISAARTATAAAQRQKARRTDTRPWWAK